MMRKSLLLIGSECPLGQAILGRLRQTFSSEINIACLPTGDEKELNQLSERKNSQAYDIIVNNVFANISIDEWLKYSNENSINIPLKSFLDENKSTKIVNISPFLFGRNVNLIPNSLPWSNLAFRLGGNCYALKYYCQNEHYIADVVNKLIDQCHTITSEIKAVSDEEIISESENMNRNYPLIHSKPIKDEFDRKYIQVHDFLREKLLQL